MKILELFAGSRSFSKVAEELGHDTFSVDIQPFDNIDYVTDILDMGDLSAKIKLFGWDTYVIDGHDLDEMIHLFKSLKIKFIFFSS